jgi:hypothetical protein
MQNYSPLLQYLTHGLDEFQSRVSELQVRPWQKGEHVSGLCVTDAELLMDLLGNTGNAHHENICYVAITHD